MRTRYTIRLLLLFSFLMILYSGLILFGIYLIATFFSIDLRGMLIGILLLWMGSGYLYVITKNIKTIEISKGLFILKKPFLRKQNEIELSKIKYTDFVWELTWNTMKGILIKYDNKVEKISIKEYNNSKDLIRLITTTCERDDSISLKIFTKEFKIWMLLGVTIVISFLFSIR